MLTVEASSCDVASQRLLQSSLQLLQQSWSAKNTVANDEHSYDQAIERLLRAQSQFIRLSQQRDRLLAAMKPSSNITLTLPLVDECDHLKHRLLDLASARAARARMQMQTRRMLPVLRAMYPEWVEQGQSPTWTPETAAPIVAALRARDERVVQVMQRLETLKEREKILFDRIQSNQETLHVTLRKLVPNSTDSLSTTLSPQHRLILDQEQTLRPRYNILRFVLQALMVQSGIAWHLDPRWRRIMLLSECDLPPRQPGDEVSDEEMDNLEEFLMDE